MKAKKLVIILLTTVISISCASATAATPNDVQQPEAGPTSVPETIQDPVQEPPQESSDRPSVNATGLHFSGQGQETFPIEKNAGMALVHLRLENCGGFVLSVKGKNIPSDPIGDQYQYIHLFPSTDGESSFTLDRPIFYEEFDASPHTEMLRVEEVSADCKWEITILPMSAARSIEPGQVVSGEYGDVLAVAGNLGRLELLFMSPGHERMIQNFGGVIAIAEGGNGMLLEDLEDAGIYDGIPPGTMYLLITSRGYWELLGR